MSFIDPGSLREYLLSLKNDELRIIASRSIYHPNKFYKIVLKKTDNGCMTRLHIWKNNTSSLSDVFYKQFPHNHSWDFKSFVLHGELVDIHYREAEHGVDPNESEYPDEMMCLKDKVTINNGEYGYMYDHHCTLVESGRYRRFVGTDYELRSDIVHTTHPIEGTITLVHQSPIIKDKMNTIYMPRSMYKIISEQKQNKRLYASLNVHDLKDLIMGVVKQLSIDI